MTNPAKEVNLHPGTPRVLSKSRVSRTSRAMYASLAKRPLTRPDMRDTLSPRERGPGGVGQVRGLFQPHRVVSQYCQLPQAQPFKLGHYGALGSESLWFFVAPVYDRRVRILNDFAAH